jgi:glyoxylase-like metal-dependent hydrolase (beta-lactamase superfamily II)
VQQPAHYRAGAFDIAIVSDGVVRMDAGASMGLIPRVMWEPIIGRENIDAEHRLAAGLNCMVVRRGDDVLLVETGMGSKLTGAARDRIFPGDYGYLLDGLGQLGLGVDDITGVVNTHLHADHCGWNTVRRDGVVVPTFPNARYYVQAGELEAAMHPNERTKGTYFLENYEPLIGSGQLALVHGERELVPGVTFVPAPGHTEDHAVVALTSGGEKALFIGDLAHHAVQVERTAWIAAFDILPLVSLETKKRLSEQAMRDNALIVVVHDPFPGVGRLREIDGRRTFVPE